MSTLGSVNRLQAVILSAGAMIFVLLIVLAFGALFMHGGNGAASMENRPESVHCARSATPPPVIDILVDSLWTCPLAPQNSAVTLYCASTPLLCNVNPHC